MENSQLNKLSMEMTTRDYLIQYPTITTNLPGFNAIMASLTSGITSIHSLAEVQLTDKTGVTESKNSLKANLIGITHEMSAKLCALAVNAGNTVLFNEVRITKSSLNACCDNVLKEYSQLIYDRANANAMALVPYGVNALALTNLLNTLNSFIAYIPKPRMSRNDKTQATLQIKQQFTIINDSLSKIDILVETLRYSQPLFYAGYKASRKRVSNGHRTLSLKATVTDAISSMPIKGAHVKVLNPDNTNCKIIEKKTADKGGVLVNNLAEGKYVISVSLPGYDAKEMEVYVTDAEMTRLRIPLARRLNA
jgi:hypothetical protein